MANAAESIDLTEQPSTFAPLLEVVNLEVACKQSLLTGMFDTSLISVKL